MSRFYKLFVLLLLPFAAGCLAVAAGGTGTGAGYHFANIAQETYTNSLEDVNKAMIKALKKMDITVIANTKTQDGRKIKCATKDLDILIDLKAVTAKTTKAAINAKAGWISRDKSTAEAILRLTKKNLGG